jgi:cbb3-type cytochrome oxidase maturation protein
MIDYFFLIPIALILGAIGLLAFLWSLKNGQYDDLDGAAERILFADDPEPRTDINARKTWPPAAV